MIALYIATDSWLHRLPAGVKLLFLCFSSILLLSVNAYVLLCAGGILMYFHQHAGMSALKVLAVFRPLLPFLLIILALHWWAGTFDLGIMTILRLAVMVLLANLITITTRMMDMMQALQPVFYPLRFVGISPRRISLAVALMVRFVPVLMVLVQALSESWRARSSTKPRWRLIPPLIIQTLKAADSVGSALQARGGAAGMPRF